jgi:hypothetical protein
LHVVRTISLLIGIIRGTKRYVITTKERKQIKGEPKTAPRIGGNRREVTRVEDKMAVAGEDKMVDAGEDKTTENVSITEPTRSK